jgi:hypothetical protein
VLDGAGYMLVPAAATGSGAAAYSRTQDGVAEGRTGRISLRDFFGGQRRAIQLERDKAFDGLAVGPALDGQGVAPWGNATTNVAVPALTTSPTASTRIPFAFVRDRLYFAVGSRLYAGPHRDGAWSAPVLEWDAGETIIDMCLYASDGLLLTFGNAKDVTFYSTTQKSSQALKAGERGFFIGGYAGYAVWNDARSAARPTYIQLVTGSGVDTRILDYDVIGFANVDAELFVITKQSIYSYNGRVKDVMIPNPAYSGPDDPDDPTIRAHQWSGEFTPYFQHGVYAEADDFRVFVGYGGRIHTWVSGQMMEDNPRGDRAGWRATGLSGRRCFGGTVAGGYIVVSIESHEGMNELWAWDGSGWWRLAQKAMSGNGTWIWPTPLGGGGSGRDLMVFREGQAAVDTFRLQHRSASVHAFPISASFVTPMIDASERDKTKAWRKVGAVFATPLRSGNLASTDAVTVSLDYSLDAGATWTQAATRSLTGNTLANNNLVLDGMPSESAATSRFIMLRVRWTSVSDWAPALVGIWAEFEVMDSPARRRRWTFRVQARDQVIDRGGSVMTKTGRGLIAGLWDAWQQGTPLPFRDQDYDADPVTRSVRIVGISESVANPADARRWGDAMVTLQLVEV